MRKTATLLALTLIVTFAAGFLLTATGVVAAPAQRTRYVTIVAQVFLDTAGYNYGTECPGCNGFWEDADWCGELLTPLPPMELVLRNADTGEEITRVTTRKLYNTGRSWGYLSVPMDGSSYMLELDKTEIPDGFVPCVTSPLSRLITPRDYRYGHVSELFYFWWGCPPAPPIENPPPAPPGIGTDDYFYPCGIFPIFDSAE